MSTSSKLLQELASLRDQINHHNYLYHSLDSPEILDAEFDQMFQRLKNIEAEHPELVSDDSPTQRVGSAPLEGFSQVTHERPMLSLDNAFGEEDLIDFDRRIQSRLNRNGDLEYICEPKLMGSPSVYSTRMANWCEGQPGAMAPRAKMLRRMCGPLNQSH